MRLCVGTSKGIVVIDADRCGAPRLVLADPSSIGCMANDCENPRLIYAGSIQHVGSSRGAGMLARSIDGGRTWKDITPRAIRDEDVWAVAASPDACNQVFIGTSHARLFRSDNSGRTFDECTAFLKVHGRERWTFPPPPHIPHVRSISFAPDDPSTVYIGVEEGGVIRSRDRGQTFELITNGIYPDIHNVIVDPHDSNRLYATTGRGFYRSENKGSSWNYIAEGISKSYTVPLLAHPRVPGVVYTAAAAGPPPTWFMGANGADAAMFRSDAYGRSFELTPV